MSTLQGKVCVVTGGAGRIGRACVDRFIAAEATVVAVDIVNVDAPGVQGVVCDLGDPRSIVQLEKTLKECYGRIDVLVNNGALGGERCAFHEKPLEEYEAVMNVNVRAPFLLSQMAIRLHSDRPDKDLSIINVASVAGHKSALLASVYSTSKHALIGLTRNVATEYAQKSVRCNSVSPGIMEIPNIQGFTPDQVQTMTSKVPMQRGGKPHEVADVIHFLASNASSYINGADILVDGGAMGGSI